MSDGIVVVLVMVFLLALIFLTFVVVPVWIVIRHSRGKRSARALANDEHSELQRLAEAEVAMRDRIATLEAILDADTPHWRRTADPDGATAAGTRT